jgi:hypothetical protein
MTISAAVLDAMVAAGCTAEQIAAAVKADMAIDEDRKASKRANNADRQRRHRERNAVSRVTGVSNGDKRDETPSSSPVPLDPPSQTLPPIIPQTPSPTPETKRASRLSTEWVLPVKWGRWAVDQGYSEATVRLESDKFRDFWCSKSGKDATKVDWEATWRNWMRNSGSSRARTTGPPTAKPKSEFMQHQDDVQRELDRARGIYRDDQFTGDTLDLGSGDYRAFHQAGAVKA